MGRPRKDIPEGSPVGDLAGFLRKLKQRAGLTHRQMSEHGAAQGRSHSTWARADSGNGCPRLDTVEAYVRVCGGCESELREARRLWREANRGSQSGQWYAPEELRERSHLGRVMRFLRCQIGDPSLREMHDWALQRGTPPLQRSTLGDALKGTHTPTKAVFMAFIRLTATVPGCLAGDYPLTAWASGADRALAGERRSARRAALRPQRARLAGDRAVPVRARRPPARPVRLPWTPPGAVTAFKEYVYSLYQDAGYPPMQGIIRQLKMDDSLDALPGRAAVTRCLGSPQLPSSQSEAETIASALARLAGADTEAAAQRAGALWSVASATPVLGRPIREIADPFAFGVRPPIVLNSTVVLPALAPYVDRDHDTMLRKVVRRAVTGHTSAAIVHGSRASGRARSCWEALNLVPDGWQLWQPSRAGDIDEVLHALATAGPRTVLWLNRIGNLLGGDPAVSQRLCFEINDLLHNPDRAPVLLLATLSPLAGLLDPIGADPHPLDPARALIDTFGIHAPSHFTGHEREGLHRHADADRRLQLAVDFAGERVTEYLTSNPSAHPAVRTRSFDHAIQTGDTSALNIGALFLETQGRIEEATTWYQQAAEQGDHLSMELASHLLGKSGMSTKAIPWLRRKADQGDVNAAVQVARQLRLSGDEAGAAHWYQRAVELGPGDTDPRSANLHHAAVHHAAQLLHRTGQTDEALEWLDRRAEDGDTEARCAMAELLWETGCTGKALESFSRAAAEGHPSALSMAGDLLRHADRLDEAITYYHRDAQAGGTTGLSHIANLLGRLPRDQALTWCENTANQHDNPDPLRTLAMRKAAQILATSDTVEDALRWGQQAAHRGDVEAMRIVAVIHHRIRRDLDSALTWYRRAADHGNDEAVDHARWITQHIRDIEARQETPQTD
ncbi:helix-turn-helix domain-containing protein [Kitasatospora sp. NPDC088346]|uniref:helix-turn-helix domain-containing protein n=1 Tax=Kitasatospora sp. NPDC088346 TaxID=3364073 RepID=UPI0038161161